MTSGLPICRACRRAGLTPILSLGRTPLANSLLSADQIDRVEMLYPLDLAFCPNCSLVQILETIPPERLFSEYPYFSSFSDTMLRHARELVQRVVRMRGLGAASLAVEIASNDGYLLQYYKHAGIPVLGVEPAANVAWVAMRERGIPTRVQFFGDRLASELIAEGVRADVLHSHNVLAHVPDLNGFVRGAARLLREDGLWIVEVPYVRDMIERCEFDTIYHEHLSYFSLTALEHVIGEYGLRTMDVERVPIHGGSLRVWIARADGSARPAAAVAHMLGEEASLGMSAVGFYQRFAARVDSTRVVLRELLCDLKRTGARIVAYGASAKGSTLLNYVGIGRDILDYVVDRSTVKQGRYTPGTHLSIEAPTRLLEDQPDYVLLLTWNFADEILEQQKEYQRRGGRFIIPIPEPTVLDGMSPALR